MWQSCSDDEGVAAIEYVLMGTLIALAFVVGAGALGGALDAMFQTAAGAFN